MAKTKPKHRPGIHLLPMQVWKEKKGFHVTEYYWHIVSKNGRIIARSSETYTRKGNAKNSILIAAEIFLGGKPYELIPYYDHTKGGEPIKSHL
jgi:uncharacterized protein YegP (UPF0339 family)